MTARFDLVTIDSPSTDPIARFWSAALGLHEVEREDGDRWLVLADADGTRRLGIQRGDVRPGSVHLDLACGPEQFELELERLVGLGARLLAEPRREPYGSIANLADPDGNAFDLCAYVGDLTG
ncbi:MAG TPA: VOC family protein [Ilumatobacteraceae bacterium]|nr:VOC family protein [Ilumatobacteraceae bacterium]